MSIDGETLKIPTEYKNVNIQVEEELNLDLTTPLGMITMSKRFGGSGSEYFYGVTQSTDGGYVVVGYPKSNTNFRWGLCNSRIY